MRPLQLLPFLAFLLLISADRDRLRAFQVAWQQAGPDAEAQAEAIRTLQGEDSDGVARLLVKILGAKEISFPVEDAIVEVLTGIRSASAVQRLAREVYTHPRWQARVIIARILGEIRDPESLHGLHRGMVHPRWAVRSAIVKSIGWIRARESIEPLIKRLAKEEGRVAGEIQWALRRITGKDLGHLEDWRTWWDSVKADFEVPSDSPPPTPQSGEPITRTKSLYGTVISEKVIFVVDISESMKVVLLEGPDRGLSRLQIMKRELCRTVMWALPKEATFNVVAYATDIYPWKKKLMPATQKNRDGVCAWVDALQLSGETNIMGALDAALSEKDVDTIYFLSDGSPSVGRLKITQEILAAVRKANGARNIVIHTFGLLGGDGKRYKLLESKDVARNFLKGLAAANGGKYTAFE